MLDGSPRKLRDGSWGCAVTAPEGSDLTGQHVTIRANNGKEWDGVISEVVAKFDGDEPGDMVYLCRTGGDANDGTADMERNVQRQRGSLEQRIADLEQRVSALEGGVPF